LNHEPAGVASSGGSLDATGEDLSGELDLAPSHERWLCEWAVREHGYEVLIVTGFPLAKRPFYTHPDPNRPGFTRGFDLRFRGLEIVTGGQRLHHYEGYVAPLTSRGEGFDGLEWYLRAFKHGMPPHGGFAIGLERWVAQLAGAANVREVHAFPLDASRLQP
jgi:nondiscriminating aspartyl-tRNA synthetase